MDLDRVGLRFGDAHEGVAGPSHDNLDSLRLEVAAKVKAHGKGDVLLLQTIERGDGTRVVATMSGHDRDHVLLGLLEVLGDQRRGMLGRHDSPGNETSAQRGDPEGQG